jgi:DNA-directed RNA polymerase specialized sigma24 family protein
LQAPAPAGQDSESGRMTFAPRGDISPLFQARTKRTFQIKSSLAVYRSRLPPLNRGHSAVIWSILRVLEALNRLSQVDERMAIVVEMRYFAGLTEAEMAEALGVTDRTIRRDWEQARLFLAEALK